MAADEKWYFTKEQLANSPSRKCGIDADKELRYRQQAANFIQDMGQRLVVSQLCINTAIVYMHRFYLFHSLTQFHRNSIAAAALFLAAKVEEQPRKLEHVIKVAHMCLHRESHPPPLDTKSEHYLEQAQDLVFNENVLLQTLGFDVAIDHPHTHVVRLCQLVKASKDLAQTSYFMASNSLHLTTMCLQYKPTVVACFCIHLACKWSNWEIPQSSEGKYWFWYIDQSVTVELLGQLTGEFLHTFDKCPSRLRKKIRSISANQSPNISHPPITNSPFDAEPRRVQSPANLNDGASSFQSSRPFPDGKTETDGNNKSSNSMPGRTSVDYREYREKKERERLEREKTAANISSGALNADPSKHHSHHHKQSMSSTSIPNKHSSSSSSTSNVKQAVHHNHHHSSRQDMKPSQMMPQRHSMGSSGQARDSNRDRQRISREYSSSSSTSNNSLYSVHTHPLDSSLDSMLNSLSQDSQTVHPPEKLSNNVHKSHDSRGNDLRHNKQQLPQKDAKPYGKYADPASATSRSSSTSSSSTRKPDILEQRSEEVRKLLIEKPLPPPKPRAEVLKEEYAAMMLKQSHHPSKYGHQPEKPVSSVNSTQPMTEAKGLNVGQTAFTMDKSPNAPIPASQVSHKSLSLGPKPGQMAVKNGNASSSSSSSLGMLGNLDDEKTEKRPRELDNSSLQTPPPPPQPPTKHRSLFSPEKTPTPVTPRESSSSHSQRSKQKQKASPAMPKQELPSLTSSNVEASQAKQRLANSLSALATVLSQKTHRSSSNAELLEQQLAEAHSRKISSQSFAGLRSLVGVKPPPELIKPFDNVDPVMTIVFDRHKPTPQQNSLNGMDSSFVKQDFLMDPSGYLQVKPELPDELLSNEMPSDLMFGKSEPSKLTDYLSHQEPVKNEPIESEVCNIKQDSYSPRKSAQSISAMLAEPLAPMPSLLQVPSYEQQQQQQQQQQLQIKEEESTPQVQPEPALPSTVDMSGLTGPIQCTLEVPAPTTTTRVMPTAAPAVISSAPVVEEKKPEKEHRSKSEKKKEKKKHKHKEKDKEKSKEKHKHKHKDKDKEKHHRDKSDREKDNKTDEGSSTGAANAALGAVPIKITIPKEKINLSSDSIGTSSTTSTSSSLKIKIPKERLKGTEVTSHQQPPVTQSNSSMQPQAPLKIKIRTDAINRSSGGGTDLQGALATSQHQDAGVGTGSSSGRKRERDSTTEVAAAPGQPPAKKQQQPRPNERQNGRHSSYNSANSNKPERFYEAVEVRTDSGEVVEGLPRNFVPTSYGSSSNIFF